MSLSEGKREGERETDHGTSFVYICGHGKMGVGHRNMSPKFIIIYAHAQHAHVHIYARRI